MNTEHRRKHVNLRPHVSASLFVLPSSSFAMTLLYTIETYPVLLTVQPKEPYPILQYTNIASYPNAHFVLLSLIDPTKRIHDVFRSRWTLPSTSPTFQWVGATANVVLFSPPDAIALIIKKRRGLQPQRNRPTHMYRYKTCTDLEHTSHPPT